MKYEQLLFKFKLISMKGYIKGINVNTNSAGLTFEQLLGKHPDSSYYPDFRGIEIKCTQRYSRFPISLFSIAFEGPRKYETSYLVDKYGVNDTTYNDHKIIIGTLRLNEKILINGYHFKLKYNLFRTKLILCIYEVNGKLVEKKSYISMKTLEKHLLVKLSNLALVYASKKEENGEKYFRYYQMTIYKLKSFAVFKRLLEKQIIRVPIMCRVSRSGELEGEQRNKGLIFQINKDDIDKLFDEVKRYNTDENWRY